MRKIFPFFAIITICFDRLQAFLFWEYEKNNIVINLGLNTWYLITIILLSGIVFLYYNALHSDNIFYSKLTTYWFMLIGVFHGSIVIANGVYLLVG